MHKVIVVIFLLVISLSSSSCFYYKSMPKDWKSQISNTENVAMFNGSYKLSDDNESLSDEYEYNDLRYFQNTVIYGLQLVYIPGLTSVNICATNNEVHVSLFSGKDMVHDSYFEKGSFDFKNGILTLDLKNQFVGGGLCMGYFAPSITMYKTTKDEVIVRQKETAVVAIIVVPAITGQNYWFKLKRIE